MRFTRFSRAISARRQPRPSEAPTTSVPWFGASVYKREGGSLAGFTCLLASAPRHPAGGRVPRIHGGARMGSGGSASSSKSRSPVTRTSTGPRKRLGFRTPEECYATLT